MTIEVEAFGEFEGQRVDRASLVSDTGVRVSIMSWGVTVCDWSVPVAGGSRSIVLGFEDFAPYPDHSPYFGALVGRVANRIEQSHFTLDGRIYRLPANEGPHCLHGGPQGISRQIWNMEPDSAGNTIRFTHTSPDGHMGFPGTVRFEAIYTLTGNRLSLQMRADPDVPTPISLVQHHYFNLGTTKTVLDHHVTIDASAYSTVDDELIPTGQILPVGGTHYDLRQGRILRDHNGAPCDYDINMVLDTSRNRSQPVARVISPDGDLALSLSTDRPGLQLYNSVTTDCAVPGLGGKIYGRYSGLCLEDQMFPGALAHAHFPSIIASPDAPYRHNCVFEIGAT